MGIGNVISSVADATHYPSAATSCPAHYPSWGSETSTKFGAPQLITPHGDRKRSCSMIRPTHYPSWGSENESPQQSFCPLDVSLPLMGIGNPLRYLVASKPHREQLITPLGNSHSMPHYPSWGSETSFTSPHEDHFNVAALKPRKRSRGSGAHYPSWGSETLYSPLISSHGCCMENAEILIQAFKSAPGPWSREGF